MTVLIRPARSEDHARLLEVWRAAVESSHHFLASEDIDYYEAMVSEYLPRMGDLRVAVDNADAVLGFLAQDAGEVHMLFIAPEAQGRGVGTDLLEAVGSQCGPLRLDVNEQNASARAFYAAKGFEEVGRSDTDGQGRPFPLVHLRRDLPDALVTMPASRSWPMTLSAAG